MITIEFYIILFFIIQSYETLRCYSCREKKQCGITFSSNSIDNKIIDGNDLYDSCSITINSNGLINRDLIPTYTCRSSSYQFCCNQDLCNSLSSPPLPRSSDVGLRCYTCDSRISGLESCSILNTSSSYVYNSGSFNRLESCAMIIGLPGKDLITDGNYSVFIIRTFIDNCVNQSLGNVTYGGALFQGRIDCCSTSLCNKDPLYTNLTLQTTTVNHNLHLPKLIVFISVVCLGLIFVLTGISLSIYRFRLYKSHDHYIPCVISDGATVLFLPSH